MFAKTADFAKIGHMKITTIAFTVFMTLILAPQFGATADFEKGLEAAQKGDYRTAIREWEPLAEDGSATILSYEVDAEVGGKLAQVGGRLIEGTSKKLAGDFFENFSGLVGSTKVAMENPAATPTTSEPVLLWVEAAIVAMILIVSFAA